MGMVPYPLPGPLGKAKPPGVANKSRRRVQSQHWEKGEVALLPRQGAGLAYCRTPTFLLLPPDMVALEGRWDPILFQNLP